MSTATCAQRTLVICICNHAQERSWHSVSHYVHCTGPGHVGEVAVPHTLPLLGGCYTPVQAAA